MRAVTTATCKASSAASAGLICLLCTLPAHAAVGHISYVTQKHAFLDVGSEDGLRVGDALTLQRTESSASGKTCKVEAVSAHHARCAGDNLPRRARFSIRHVPPPPLPITKTTHFSGLGRTRVQQVRAALDAAPFELVANQSLSGQILGHGYVSLQHDAWVWTGTQPRTVQGERLELSARVAPFARFPDLTASLRMTALYWSEQSSVPLRFRPNTSAQFYVWQGDVSERGIADNVVFGVGRTRTWYTPGLAVLDGAQIGYRSDDATSEIGVYGGSIPNPSVLTIASDHLTAGIYSRVQGQVGTGWTLGNTGRLAYVELPDPHTRLELETRTELTRGQDFQLAVSPRIGFDLSSSAVQFDALRVDLFGQPDDWRLYAGARYANANVDISNGIISPTQILRSTLFGDASIAYQANQWFALGVLGTGARDNDNDYTHVTVGPNLILPRMFGRYGSLSGSALYEASTFPQTTAPAFGGTAVVPGSAAWIPGYSVALQSILTPTDRVSLWLRISYLTDRFQTVSTLQQLGWYLRGQAVVSSWLDIGAFVRVNQGLENANVALPAPTNILGSLQLTGHI